MLTMKVRRVPFATNFTEQRITVEDQVRTTRILARIEIKREHMSQILNIEILTISSRSYKVRPSQVMTQEIIISLKKTRGVCRE